MRYPLAVPGFEDHEIAVDTGGFWSGATLLIDGEPAPKGPKRGEFLLRRADGTEAAAQLRTTNFLDPIPQVLIDGEKYSLAEPLKWYEWVWSGLPFLLALSGGALGGLFGGLALALNSRVFRSKFNSPLKYLFSGLISGAAVIAFFISATIFSLGIRTFFPSPAKEFKSEAGGFTVMTNATLKETVQSIDTQLGKIDLHMFIGEQGNQSFIVGYSDYPAELVKASNPQKMLDGSREGAITNSNGTLVSEVPISMDGFPGRELVISVKADSGQDLSLRVRYYLVENRLYQVMAVILKGDETKPEIVNYLDSFKIIQK